MVRFLTAMAAMAITFPEDICKFVHSQQQEKNQEFRHLRISPNETMLYQWLFLVPIKGGRWHIIPNWQYIPIIYHLYIAFWGVICYLPPFRGTRNNHWLYVRHVAWTKIYLHTLRVTEYIKNMHICIYIIGCGNNPNKCTYFICECSWNFRFAKKLRKYAPCIIHLLSLSTYIWIMAVHFYYANL